ncbi:MAG: DUF456 domain-containing protein [Pseudomonadota bacterium]
MSIAAIALGIVLVGVGLVGVVLPLLPGSPLVLAGLVLIAWAEGFAHVGPSVLGVLVGLTLLTFVVDQVASLLGAVRSGASRLGLAGAAVGAVVGVFFLPIGLLLGPFCGAVVGELLTQRDALRAGRVGMGAVVGVLLGTLGNLAINVAMIAIFLLARWSDTSAVAA